MSHIEKFEFETDLLEDFERMLETIVLSLKNTIMKINRLSS